jgi:hypothetical protein
LVLNASCCLASQHIRGDLNIIADLLSFSGGITCAGGKRHPIAFDDPPNNTLTQRFHLYYMEQIPANSEISQLPSEILSWVLSILRIAASSLTAELKAATKPTTKPGGAGSVSAPQPEEPLTLSSLCYPQSDGSSLSDPSLSAFAQHNSRKVAEKLQASIKSQWSQALCAKPQGTWLRRFGTICNRAPCTLRAQPSCSLPSAPSSRPLQMPTQPSNDSRPSPQSCHRWFIFHHAIVRKYDYAQTWANKDGRHERHDLSGQPKTGDPARSPRHCSSRSCHTTVPGPNEPGQERPALTKTHRGSCTLPGPASCIPD